MGTVTHAVLLALAAVAAVGVPAWGLRLLLRYRSAAKLFSPKYAAPALEEAEPPSFDSFSRKMRWLAVRSDSPRAVARALDLKGVQRAHWAEGLREAEHDGVFLTPPVDGWVLVISTTLAPLSRNLPLLQIWSRTLATEVQQFGTDEGDGEEGFARVRAGRVLRARALSRRRPDVAVDRGQRDPEEPDLGELLPVTAGVLRLAALWSVNPGELHTKHVQAGPGWIARW